MNSQQEARRGETSAQADDAATVGDHGTTATPTAFSHAGAKPPVVQLKEGASGPTASDRAYGAVDDEAAGDALACAVDILENGNPRGLATAPHRFATALHQLFAAQSGQGEHGKLSASDRLSALDAASHGLHPAIAHEQAMASGRAWLHQQKLVPQLQSLRTALEDSNADARIDAAACGPDAVAGCEQVTDKNAREQGKTLHQQIHGLVKDIRSLQHKMKEGREAIENDTEPAEQVSAEAAYEEEEEAEDQLPEDELGKLHGLANTLILAGSLLDLTDEEFHHELSHVKNVFNGVATYTELVKAATQLALGGAKTVADCIGFVAKRRGLTALAEDSFKWSKAVGEHMGNVVAVLEIVHGLSQMLDTSASSQKRADGAVDVASGSAMVAGQIAAHYGVAGAATAGFAVSTAIVVSYEEFKFFMKLYGQAEYGIIASWMHLAFDGLKEHRHEIAEDFRRIGTCAELRMNETDHAKAAALDRALSRAAGRLGQSIDYLIEDCARSGYAQGSAAWLGNYPVLHEALSPILSYHGVSDPRTAIKAAGIALERIDWALTHQPQIAEAEVKHRHVSDIERDDEKKKQHAPAAHE